MTEGEEEDGNVFRFQDEPIQSDPIHDYTEQHRTAATPIIIDNGCFNCRVGWATDKEPCMIFKNVIAKQRGKVKGEMETQIGNDISSIEVVRYLLRSQFDRNLVTQYDAQEQIYDYIFTHLGIDTPGSVNHPIVLTEPVCNPGYCRQQMSELLFECYHIPEVTYGVSSMFSLYNNYNPSVPRDSLILSCGYQTSHILPVLDGRIVSQCCRRINIGGCHIDGYMQRLLQLKYPGHLAAVTLSRAESLVKKHTYMSVDYLDELSQWAIDDYYCNNVHKYQLPYTAANIQTLSAEQQKERRQHQVRRMKEMNSRRREERMANEQEKLQHYLNVQEFLEGEDRETCERALQRLGYHTMSELKEAINTLNNSINRLRNTIVAEETGVPVGGELFGDEDEDGAEPKKKQRGQKSPAESPNKRGTSSLPGNTVTQAWLEKIRKQRQDLLNARIERRKRRTDMTKRRTQASQQRMKIITELAQGPRKKKEDTFGQNDDDWNVYKAINKDGGDSDSEAETEKLLELDNLLREHDPDFKDPNEPEPVYDPKEYYRLHIGIERIRVPELLFQPSMIGLEQAGLAETMEFVLKKFSPDEQNRMVQNVFITGGCASFPNFKKRVEKELLAMRPFQSTFRVRTAENPVVDAWYGARRWANSEDYQLGCISREDYQEKGAEYLREHLYSNRYFPTPVVYKPPSHSEVSSLMPDALTDTASAGTDSHMYITDIKTEIKEEPMDDEQFMTHSIETPDDASVMM